MYNIYCDAIHKRKKGNKKGQKKAEIKNRFKYISKTKTIEEFSKSELKDVLYDKLKNHLFINITKRHLNINKLENQVIIDLSRCNTSTSEENICNFIKTKENLNDTEEKNEGNKLIKPIFV